MKDYLIILLPVVWALVSTGIALVLYRTSDSLFEQRSKDQSSTRRIRLTGSIVIAGVAFFGMQKSTPDLTTESEEKRQMRRSDIQTLSRSLGELEDQLNELDGCASTRGPQNCTSIFANAHLKTRDISNLVKQLAE